MSEASKPTPGKWKRELVLVDGEMHHGVVTDARSDHEVVAMTGAALFGGEHQEEAIATADLVVEAGNVYNETGLTPRQLVEQRDALAKALEDLLHNSSSGYSGEKDLDEDFERRYKIASDAGLAALALVKGGEK